MAHIKMNYFDHYACCYGGHHICDDYYAPRVTDCPDYKEGVDLICTRSCPVFVYEEKNLKSFKVVAHDSTFDYMYWYYDLETRGRTYLCNYLEVDGHVFIDQRGDACD